MSFNNIPPNGWPQLKGLENLTDEISGLDTRLDAVENTVGDEDSGLVKDVTALKTTVGDADSGLVKDVAALKTTVGDNTAGLVKDVSSLYPSSYITTGLTYTNCSLQAGGYCKIGNVVIINVRINTSADNVGSPQISGFPANDANMSINGLGAVAVKTNPNGFDVVPAYVTKQGILAVEDVDVSTIYFVTAIYLANPPTPPETRDEDQDPADDTKTATIKRKKS